MAREAVCPTWPNVVLDNVHELVPVRPRVFVEEAQRVHQLVGNDSLRETLVHFQRDRLVSAGPADIGRAAGKAWCLEGPPLPEGHVPLDVYVVEVVLRPGHKADTGLLLVLVEGLGDGSSLAEKGPRSWMALHTWSPLNCLRARSVTDARCEKKKRKDKQLVRSQKQWRREEEPIWRSNRNFLSDA